MALLSRWPLSTDYSDTVGSNTLAAAGSGNSFAGSRLVLNGSGYASKTAGVTGVTSGNADRAMGIYFTPTTASTVEGIMAVGDVGGSQGFTILKLSATSIRVDLYGDPLAYTVPAMSNTTRYGIWIEYTSGTKSSRLWLGGSESSSGSQAHVSNSSMVTNKIYLGADMDAGNLFTGKLDSGIYYNGIPGAGARDAFFNPGAFTPKVIYF